MPYGGRGVRKSDYEVLLASDKLTWKSINIGEHSADAVKTGEEYNLDPLYSVKKEMDGKLYIGKYNGSSKAYFVVDGIEKEVLGGQVELLCSTVSEIHALKSQI